MISRRSMLLSPMLAACGPAVLGTQARGQEGTGDGGARPARAMKAYDIDVLPRSADRRNTQNHGWCFGLPPGIAPEQWPLDANNGYPLMHGFTLRLPEDYRVHGPEIVAVSFFATAPDHNDGGAARTDAIRAAITTAADVPAPADPDLLPFWRAERGRHPRMRRMTDILELSYAAILLTEAEFQGPLRRPPAPAPSGLLARIAPPGWLTNGSAWSYWNGVFSPSLDLPKEQYGFYRLLGELPAKDVAYDRGLAWTPRAADPNAGAPPRDEYAPDKTGYRQWYYYVDGKVAPENFREHDWAKGHKPNHIGGTMRPSQNVPAMSPFYVEFEESFGGYNFGGGNAQLDFGGMTFDWAQ